MDRYDDVVVGGGVAGIIAAILQVQKGRKVLLLEQSSSAGGLLQTYTSSGYQFDYGTHFLAETGIAGLDELLFRNVCKSDWIEFSYLKSGHYVNNALCEKSQAIDANTLEDGDLSKGALELINAAASRKESYINLEEQLNANFGKTYSSKLIIPAVEKLFKTQVNELSQNVHHIFGLTRLQSFSVDSTKLLKEISDFDDVIAYHSHKEGLTGLKRFYPKQGGIGVWVNSLLELFLKYGGEVKYNQSVSSIECHDSKVSAVKLGEASIGLKHLIWTAPAIFLAKLIGVHNGLANKPLSFLNTFLFNLVLDQAPITDIFCYNNYQPDMMHFRTTIYSNIQPVTDNQHRVTVEVFTKSHELECPLTPMHVLNELIRCGVFASTVKIVHSNTKLLCNSFPVLTNEFFLHQKAQVALINDNVSNVSLYGKARGDIFL